MQSNLIGSIDRSRQEYIRWPGERSRGSLGLIRADSEVRPFRWPDEPYGFIVFTERNVSDVSGSDIVRNQSAERPVTFFVCVWHRIGLSVDSRRTGYAAQV